MVGVTNEKSYEFHFLSTPLKKNCDANKGGMILTKSE